MVTRLSSSELDTYTGSAEVPQYERTRVTAGIAHIGVGNFHRSHQAAYVDALLREGEGAEWGIVGIGILPGDQQMRDALEEQAGLYTLVTQATGQPAVARVIASIVDYLFVPDDPAGVVERLADPTIRVVTLTVTEGGYNLSPSSGSFDAHDPVILAEARDEGLIRTHFRLLRDALALRRERGIAPFTIASCDNIRTNGDVARETLVQFTALSDPGLAAWIEQEVQFPNSMVDRITPMTKPEDRIRVQDEFGLDDLRPVFAEEFVQWVVEDRFPTGRPELQKVGVQFVDDVLPFELMKLRLLNASHQVIAYFSFLRGHEIVHTAMADPAVAAVVARFQEEEAEPTLPPVPGVDLALYRATLLDRFANPAIEDTVARLCAQSSTSIPNFVLPVIRDQLSRGGRIDVAASVVAAWATYAAERGDWRIVDRRRESIVRTASDPDPLAFLDDRSIFGGLADDAAFRRAFASARRVIDDDGIAALLELLAAGKRL
jgi:mannitol 2-dehydrogenase